MEEMGNIVTLVDEEGTKVRFEILDVVEYNGADYAVLAALDGENADSVIILGVEYGENGEETLVPSDDYDTLDEVFEIFKENHLRGVRPSPSLVIIKQYMDENFTSPELRISDLAKLHKTSEAYFRREFKKYYAESPLEYIKRRRIEMACHLLCTELYSITDVASRSGFDSVSYFSSEFKRYMGCSPKEYRNM